MSILTRYPHLAGRVFNTPLLVHPQKLDAIIAGLGHRLLGADPAGAAAGIGVLNPALFSTRNGAPSPERGYKVTDGVAVINVAGVLVHRSTFVMADSAFLLGYNAIAADIEDAISNPDVHALLLVFDSPGGEVSGAFELAQRIFQLRGTKPIWAIADGMAASAAYLAASAADVVATTTTGYTGSVGVVMRHADYSKALEKEGITVTQIFAGAHKVDGNPYEPLPASVRAEFAAEIEDIHTMFVDAVARHRNLNSRAVRDTEAAVFRGGAAIASRLADRTSTTDQLIAELAAQRAGSFPVGQPARITSVNQGASMTDTTQAGTPPASTAAVSAADIDAARAEATAQERARITAILTHPEAEGRTALANQCVAQGLSPEAAAALLAASPKAAAPAAAAASQFDKHMAALNPNVSGVEAPEHDASDPKVIADSWAQAFGAARPN